MRQGPLRDLRPTLSSATPNEAEAGDSGYFNVIPTFAPYFQRLRVIAGDITVILKTEWSSGIGEDIIDVEISI